MIRSYASSLHVVLKFFMKISKLFHWLYSFIMFLPVFAVGGKVAYTVFNKNAYQSYSANQLNIQLLPINSTLSYNKNYYFYTDSITTFTSSNHFIETYTNTEIVSYSSVKVKENKLIKFKIRYVNDNLGYLDCIYYNDNNEVTNGYFDFNVNQPISFKFNVGGNTNLDTSYNLFIKEIATNVENTLDNAFYYAVDQVRDNVLFSCANNSFLATPITYVTDLFGMPSDSPIITYLSYWLDISIIWLTFDVIMYVPLLIHRWLDKGVLE